VDARSRSRRSARRPMRIDSMSAVLSNSASRGAIETSSRHARQAVSPRRPWRSSSSSPAHSSGGSRRPDITRGRLGRR
jgi:hypothetical protein